MSKRSFKFRELKSPLSSYEEYYVEFIEDVLKHMGVKYDDNVFADYKERLVITLEDRPLPKKSGSVIEYVGERWFLQINGVWRGESGCELINESIDDSWRQIL